MTQYAAVYEQNNEKLTKDKNYEKKWRKKNGPPFIDFTMLVVFMSQPHVVNQNDDMATLFDCVGWLFLLLTGSQFKIRT
jgi:hypothetical protein